MSTAPFLVDTHCHLQMPAFEGDLEEVLQRASSQGVDKIIVPGIDLDSSMRALELAEKHENILAAAGIHPHEANSWNNTSAARIAELAAHPEVVAVGEIGLDYFRNHAPREAQLRAYHEQMDLAADLEMPVIIHNRDATQDVLARARQSGEHPAGVLHAFSAGAEAARQAVDEGFMIGIGGPITFKKSAVLRELVIEIGLDALVLETDAPYMTPHPLRGKRNEPGFMRYTAEVLAESFDTTLDNVAKLTTRNAVNLFQLNDE